MFANALMLFGLTAVSVPIIIHLLNRRKFERVIWAAMRFLRISVEQNQRRLQLEDILLLLIRCALIALIVLALARPRLRSIQGDAPVTAVLLLDNSYSMSQTDGINSRFGLAKDAATKAINALPKDSSVAILLASDIVQDVIPEPTYDMTLATSAVKKAVLFDRGTDLYDAVRRAVETLTGRATVEKEIYLVTDGQASGWRKMRDIRRLLEEHKDIRTHIVLVGQDEPRDLGVTAVKLDSALCPVNEPQRVDVRVKNFGTLESRQTMVRIWLDTEPAATAEATVPALRAGEDKVVSMSARIAHEGYHTITARLEPDHLPANDSRSIALRAVKTIQVLLIEGDAGQYPEDSEVFFLKQALLAVPADEWGSYYLKVIVKAPSELDSVHWSDFDAVFAANVTDFSRESRKQIAEYVQGGRSLMLFLGDKINRRGYDDLYNDGLLPAKLGGTRGDANSQDKWFTLADRYDHDIVSIWRDTGASLTSARFYKIYDLVIPDAASAKDQKNPTRTILTFADGKPAMVEKAFGRGRVILFASTADRDWTDLPRRAAFRAADPAHARLSADAAGRAPEHTGRRAAGASDGCPGQGRRHPPAGAVVFPAGAGRGRAGRAHARAAQARLRDQRGPAGEVHRRLADGAVCPDQPGRRVRGQVGRHHRRAVRRAERPR